MNESNTQVGQAAMPPSYESLQYPDYSMGPVPAGFFKPSPPCIPVLIQVSHQSQASMMPEAPPFGNPLNNGVEHGGEGERNRGERQQEPTRSRVLTETIIGTICCWCFGVVGLVLVLTKGKKDAAANRAAHYIGIVSICVGILFWACLIAAALFGGY